LSDASGQTEKKKKKIPENRGKLCR
jgi:hypothetical protein